jgi:hypothetical protein
LCVALQLLSIVRSWHDFRQIGLGAFKEVIKVSKYVTGKVALVNTSVLASSRRIQARCKYYNKNNKIY